MTIAAEPQALGDDSQPARLRSISRLIGWLAALSLVGIVAELAIARHWDEPVQFIPWVTCGVMAGALVLAWRAPTPAQVRAIRLVSAAVAASSLFGIWEHIESNYNSGPLDFRYANTWAMLSEPDRWWKAITKTVGPSPTLVPGAMVVVCGLVWCLTMLRRPTGQITHGDGS